jgi:hypothetical protein
MWGQVVDDRLVGTCAVFSAGRGSIRGHAPPAGETKALCQLENRAASGRDRQLDVRLCVWTDRRCARIRAAHHRHAEKERIVSWDALTSPGYSALSWLRGRRSRWTWQRLCALVLCTTSPLLYLFASICLATGIFHAAIPHQTHHHHHAGPAAHHPAGLPDICDFAHQALTTTVVAPVPLLLSVLAPGDTLRRPRRLVLPIAPVSRHGVRAPPLGHA